MVLEYEEGLCEHEHQSEGDMGKVEMAVTTPHVPALHKLQQSEAVQHNTTHAENCSEKCEDMEGRPIHLVIENPQI